MSSPWGHYPPTLSACRPSLTAAACRSASNFATLSANCCFRTCSATLWRFYQRFLSSLESQHITSRTTIGSTPLRYDSNNSMSSFCVRTQSTHGRAMGWRKTKLPWLRPTHAHREKKKQKKTLQTHQRSCHFFPVQTFEVPHTLLNTDLLSIHDSCLVQNCRTRCLAGHKAVVLLCSKTVVPSKREIRTGQSVGDPTLEQTGSTKKITGIVTSPQTRRKTLPWKTENASQRFRTTMA